MFDRFIARCDGGFGRAHPGSWDARNFGFSTNPCARATTFRRGVGPRGVPIGRSKACCASFARRERPTSAEGGPRFGGARARFSCHRLMMFDVFERARARNVVEHEGAEHAPENHMLGPIMLDALECARPRNVLEHDGAEHVPGNRIRRRAKQQDSVERNIPEDPAP